MSNLDFWNSVCSPDVSMTKEAKLPGGFKATAVSPMATYLKATEKWGPEGLEYGHAGEGDAATGFIASAYASPIPTGGWGFTIDDESYLPPGPDPHEHVIRVSLWYPWQGKMRRVQAVGCTLLKGKYGPENDIAKKTLTDARGKALSYVGYNADLHLGKFDDVAYVNRLTKEQKTAAKTAATGGPEHPNVVRIRKLLETAADKGAYDTLRTEYTSLPQDQKDALTGSFKAAFKRLALEKGV